MLRILALELMVDNLEDCAFCFLPFFPLSDVVSMWLTRHRDVNRLEYEFRCSVEGLKGCVCVFVGACLLTHVCVWKAGVDTDTAAPLSCSICSQDVWGTLHRLAPSNLGWNRKPRGWKDSASEDPVRAGTREARDGGAESSQGYGRKLWRSQL